MFLDIPESSEHSLLTIETFLNTKVIPRLVCMRVTNPVTKFVTKFVTSLKKLVTSNIEMYLQSGTVWVVHLCHTLMFWVKFQHFEDEILCNKNLLHVTNFVTNLLQSKITRYRSKMLIFFIESCRESNSASLDVFWTRRTVFYKMLIFILAGSARRTGPRPLSGLTT